MNINSLDSIALCYIFSELCDPLKTMQIYTVNMHTRIFPKIFCLFEKSGKNLQNKKCQFSKMDKFILEILFALSC